MMVRRSFTLLCCVPLLACSSAAIRAAERGDTAKLREVITAKHKEGKLGNDEARDIARAVAEREIASAKDEPSAVLRLHETRACAVELDDAFEDRMKRKDGAGAEAALSRLESGKLSEGDARSFLKDADDRWRAVGTRTLHRDDDRKARQAAMLDPSPRVRRGAIRAAADAKDAADIDVLVETARVDPDLLLRNEAVRSISAILRGLDEKAARPRAEAHALRLRDLWTNGDDALKEDIAVAWALSPVFEGGGREALRVAIADGKGPGAIAAAGVVARAHAKDGELASAAQGLLARTIIEGSRRDRLHALATAPRLKGAIVEAIKKAAQDDDLDVKVPALAALLELPPDREPARKELVTIAGYGIRGGDDPRMLTHASRARHALAASGDRSIQAWVETDLLSADPFRKTAAASALAALGRPARAAPLLVDPDPSIRTRAACTMLMAARHD
jgi:hypothetical protein